MASLLQRITRRGSDAAPARIERRSLDNWTASTGLSLMKGSNIIGGLRNSLSGLGGATDKSINSYFTPTLIRNRYMMELFYNESWVASKFVDAPIDDMFVKWRRHTGEDEQAIQAMDDLEETLDMRTALAQSMKMGRIFGSGLLIMVTTEAPMEEPLDPRRIREGDLKNLLYLDRFNASIESWTQDLTNPNFARPEVYRIRSHMLEEELYVHHSRILRFDGKRSLNMEGWSGYYDRYWGVSEMAAAIIEVFHDAGTAASTAHLMQEASIPTVKIKRYRESLLNHPTPESPDMTALALAMSQSKGIFRTLFMDAAGRRSSASP